MTKHLYYNPVAATGDPRKGMGYGKSQKIPSFGTGQGSERSMGSMETGIYTEPYESEDEEDEEDLGLGDRDDIDKFVKKINKMYSVQIRHSGQGQIEDLWVRLV